MNTLFQRTNASWVRFSEYEYKQGEDGTLYLTPAPNSQPEVYDTINVADALVVEALNIGRRIKTDADLQEL